MREEGAALHCYADMQHLLCVSRMSNGNHAQCTLVLSMEEHACFDYSSNCLCWKSVLEVQQAAGLISRLAWTFPHSCSSRRAGCSGCIAISALRMAMLLQLATRCAHSALSQ